MSSQNIFCIKHFSESSYDVYYLIRAISLSKSSTKVFANSTSGVTTTPTVFCCRCFYIDFYSKIESINIYLCI